LSHHFTALEAIIIIYGACPKQPQWLQHNSSHNKHFNYRRRRTVNMSKSFVVALRPFLVMSKTLGLMSIMYTFDSGSMYQKSSNEMHFVCLELIRTTMLVGFTYVFHVNNTFYLRELVLFKFWTTIFMTRIYENWIIRLDRTYDCCNIIYFLLLYSYSIKYVSSY